MQAKLNRTELDELADHYALEPDGVETMLTLANARPGRRDTLDFLARVFRIGGVLSLAASIVFFVAANWSAMAVFGRFALIELLLVLCVVAALIKPPPSGLGRAAMLLAFVTTGALLALFGQTYQTGADIYELFLTWTLLGLPFVLLARWSVSSAAWFVVLNTSLMLYCGLQPVGGLLWLMLGSSHLEPAYILMGACALNVGLWFLFELREIPSVPQWVRRIVISCAFGFGCWAGITAIFGDEKGAAGALLLLAIAMAAVFLYARHRRDDIFPIAVVMGTFIVVSFALLADRLSFNEEAMLLVYAAWLIGTSTGATRWLVAMARDWRGESA